MAKIIGVSKFERLFREAAGLDVDKNDLARLNDFVRQKVYDLLLAAQATAKDNQRDVIQLHDLPLTLGFKEHAGRRRAGHRTGASAYPGSAGSPAPARPGLQL